MGSRRVRSLSLWICAWTIFSRIAPGPMPAGLNAAPLEGTNLTVQGKITRHEPGKLIINTEENIVFHVKYGETTKIARKDGSPGSAKELQTGVKVKIEGELNDSGEVEARRIEVE